MKIDPKRLRLYAVTDRAWTHDAEGLLRQVAAAVDGGAGIVQLREKHMGQADFLAEAERFVALCREKGAVSIINDNVEIAAQTGADGVHVGQEDLEAGRIKPEDTVTASARAASFGGSCVYLEAGEKMSVHEMLKCIAVVSANDCAVAMAEFLSGSEKLFVDRMNRRADELGLENTHFTNCTGLFDDAEHYTSARDLAIMSRELIKHDFIKDYTTIWMDSIRNGEFGLSNTNKLSICIRNLADQCSAHI